MSTTKSSVRVTIECVDSCEILIVPPTSRRRRHDQEDEATMTTSEINAKRARILQWNQEVLAAARQVSIDECFREFPCARYRLFSTRIQGEGRASRVPAAAAACPAQQCLVDRVHLVFKDLPVFGYIINAVSTTVPPSHVHGHPQRQHASSTSPKGSIGRAFAVSMRTEHRDQASFCPFALREVSVLAELALGHLRYSLTDVPPQSNSPPGSVLESDHVGVQLANGRGRTPLLHTWLKNTVTAGIWIPGARVSPNRITSSISWPFRIWYSVLLRLQTKSHGGDPASTCIAEVDTVLQTHKHAYNTIRWHRFSSSLAFLVYAELSSSTSQQTRALAAGHLALKKRSPFLPVGVKLTGAETLGVSECSVHRKIAKSQSRLPTSPPLIRFGDEHAKSCRVRGPIVPTLQRCS
ncbi:unnamed protein product [Trichogramma brassicae]|uniref:Uncharacterized protein n=1 Tax=Trichogramma brassicae TaxID=86971 RepID=A0A6H5ICK3_9HYME|nr:unnamed protein product [Trichogramma brassicae]